MNDSPDPHDEFLLSLERLTQAGAAVWLYRSDAPELVYCFVANERIDFTVYVDAGVTGSPAGNVAAINATFRNLNLMFLQPDMTAPHLLTQLRGAQDDRDLLRVLQQKCLQNAISSLRGMVCLAGFRG